MRGGGWKEGRKEDGERKVDRGRKGGVKGFLDP